MPEVVTLGEAMVVFNPDDYLPLDYVHSFTKGMAGAEANFSIGIVRLGHEAGWISRIGDDPFGRFILKSLKGEGVDVSKVKIDSEHPTGIYFKERKSARNINVYYYRKGSAASFMSPEDLDEGYISSAKLLHITGITPALSQTCRETVYRAIQIAKEKNVTVSFDPNIRLKLWNIQECRKTLLDIAKYADIVLPGRDEGGFLLDTDDPETIAKAFLDLGARVVAVKLGPEGAMAMTDNEVMYDSAPDVAVVDTIGAGDGFAAGFITGVLNGWDIKQCLRLANDVGSIVVSSSGDVEGLPTMEEVEIFRGNIKKVDR